jgi:protoporphyrinogen oxidase
MVYERMKDAILAKGGKVHLKTPVKRVLQKNGAAYGLELDNGAVHEFDHIVSSMPFTLIVTRLPETPQHILDLTKTLTFRNTMLVYLKVEGKDLFPDNWLYVHSTDLKMGRITNFRNWVPEILNGQDSTIVVLEYWCYDNDPEWNQSEEAWIELAKKELNKTGLIKGAPISAGFVYKIPRCYPVYSRGYKERLKPVEEYLTTVKNLSVIGRYGAFKYNNQDHSILMGLLAAENIVKGTNHNLWEINTDYEDYQESSTITEAGLASK